MTTDPEPNSPSPDHGPGRHRIRLQRVLADAGIAARRVCEQLIADGHVTVNGETTTKLPVFVDPNRDDIRVDGRPIPKPDRPIYLMVHKPARTMVTTAPEPGDSRTTILQWVDHPATPRLFPVGRLDYDSTGLVLLTNDGDLANRLTHPRYETPKTYLATVKGTPTDEVLAELNKRLRKLDEREARVKYGKKARIETVTELAMRGQSRPKIRVVQSTADRSLVEIALVESRHGQIEELLRILGCPVKKLVRVAYGPIMLKGLAPGRWRELSREEARALKDAAYGRGPKTPPVGLNADHRLSDSDADDTPTPRPASEMPSRPRRRRPQPNTPPADWTWRAVGRSKPSPAQRERDLRRASQKPREPEPTPYPPPTDERDRPPRRPRFGPNTQFRDAAPLKSSGPKRRRPAPADPFSSGGPPRGPKPPPRNRPAKPPRPDRDGPPRRRGRPPRD